MGLLVRPVARTYHRRTGGAGEPHFFGFFFVHLEGIGMHVAADRQVVAGGGEVLADGQHFDVVGAQVAHVATQ